MDGTTVDYDVLVIATGAALLPEETEGLAGPGRGENVHTFYTLEGATSLAEALEQFDGGRMVVNVVDMPIKCPVAPLEFCFLADWFFTDRKIRDRVEITYVTPLDAAFTKPVAAATLGGMLDERGIELVTEFNTGEVDGPGGRLVSYDEREVPFDLAVVVPLHGGQPYVARSEGLGDDVELRTHRPAHAAVDREAQRVRDRRRHHPPGVQGRLGHALRGRGPRREHPAVPRWRRVGRDRMTVTPTASSRRASARRCSSTSTTTRSPSPVTIPPRVGLPLLKESRMNHLGKLMFQWFYWHVLLPGRDVPGVGSDMPTAGKQRPRTTNDPESQEDLYAHARPSRAASVDANDEGFFTDPGQWTEAMAPELATGGGHRPADRSALDRHQVHARRLRQERNRTDRPSARQDVGRVGQGAVPALPEGSRQRSPPASPGSPSLAAASKERRL
ncbi:MAG: hypothetical protein V9E94_20305 [Microthrixaceae bacterium]